jgi:hypothetical protein
MERQKGWWIGGERRQERGEERGKGERKVDIQGTSYFLHT